MIDKQYLIKQLNRLNDKVTPDRKWKKAQRQILLSQWRSQVEEVPGVFQLEKEYAVFGAFRWLLKPVLMLLVLVMGSGYVGVWASENSLPGDLLYPIKITSEKIQVKLTFDEHKKAELHVELAKKRTDEIKQLKQKDTVDSNVVKETYTKVKEEMSEAKNTLQVIKDKKEAEPGKVNTVEVLTSAEKVDEALRNIDESLKNNIGGPVDDEENQLLADALVGVEGLKADVTAVVKDAVAANPTTLSTSTEASEAVNKIIERETKEITVKADSLTQTATSVTPVADLPKQEPVIEVVPVQTTPAVINTNASVTGTSTSSSSGSATAGGSETVPTETPVSPATSIKVESPVIVTTEEAIIALLLKVEEILKTPLTSAQVTDAKTLNDQLMAMVTKLVNEGKSDKALLLLETSKRLIKAIETIVKPATTSSAEMPVTNVTTVPVVESTAVQVNTVTTTNTSVMTIPSTGVETPVQNP